MSIGRSRFVRITIYDDGPKSNTRRVIRLTERDFDNSCFHEDDHEQQKDCPFEEPSDTLFVWGFIKQRKGRCRTTNCWTNCRLKWPTLCCQWCRKKNKNKKSLGFCFLLCIMTIWMTIYTFSSTGVFTIEAVSVCADITVLCRGWLCCESHILADVT